MTFRTSMMCAAIAGLALAAFATAPPAIATTGHSYSAPKFQVADASAMIDKAKPVHASITVGHDYIGMNTAKNDDPAAKIDKAALSKNNDGDINGIGHISANNDKVGIDSGGSEVAVTEESGAKNCVLQKSVPLANNLPNASAIAGATSS